VERTHRRHDFQRATPFSRYVEEVEANHDLWNGLYRRARVPEELVEAARSAGGPWYLLALSEDWCGDAVNALPIIARWAEAVPGMELRILGRDDNPELMDAHLTGGRSRSIPVVMVLDRDFREVGWWGPRPRVLQDWVLGEGRSLRPQERYKRVRSWYARDRGRTVLEELLALLGGTAGGLATPSPGEAPAVRDADVESWVPA
jgi:hypothetical protein